MSGALPRLLLVLAACTSLASVATACGGDDGGEAQPQPTQTQPETQTQTAPPEEPPLSPQETLSQFLEAVEKEAAITWDFVSAHTKTSLELTQPHWQDVLLPALNRDLQPGGDVIFTERIDEERALVVVESGTPDAPFAAALRNEDAQWKVELFYPEFTPTRPAPGETVKRGNEELLLDVIRRADQTMDVKLWFNGEPVTLELRSPGKFVNTYAAQVPVRAGTNLVVAYATTEAGLSGGAAWTFSGR